MAYADFSEEDGERIARSVRAFEAGRQGKHIPKESESWRHPDRVMVKNMRGSAFRIGEVCELEALVLDTEEAIKAGACQFEAELPDETRPFGIVLQPLGTTDSTKFGAVQIAGICRALIDVQATTDRWAFVESGQDRLKSDHFWGDVRILHEPGGTGEQLCWVSIEKSPQVWFGKADAAIVMDATGTVSIWTGSTPSDSGFNIASCLNWTGITVDSGSRVRVERIDRKPRVFPLECPA